MNNEVKELIDTLKEYGDGFTSVLAPTEESVKALLDYINQLEKEVERLKEREKLVTEHYNVMVRYSGNLEGKIIQLETNINTVIDFIDQVLQYHLSPFDYKQVDEDINTLIGILRSDSNE